MPRQPRKKVTSSRTQPSPSKEKAAGPKRPKAAFKKFDNVNVAVEIGGQLQLLLGWVLEKRWNGKDSWEYRLSGAKKNSSASISLEATKSRAGASSESAAKKEYEDWIRESDLELDEE